MKLPSAIIRSSLLCGLLVQAQMLNAQTLNESIAVEGRYQAEIVPAERIWATPAEYPVGMERETLPYDLARHNAAFMPESFPLPLPFPKRESARGYLNAAVGSWLDSKINAGAWLIPPSPSRQWDLGVWLRHNSTSLWRPAKQLTRRFDYDERIGFQTKGLFSNGQSLKASLEYNLDYFNCFMIKPAPTQTVNNLDFNVSWKSAPGKALQHDLTFNASYFGYREGARQTNLKLKGGVSSSVGDNNTSGIPDRMSLAAEALASFGNRFAGNWGLAGLTPAYHSGWKGFRYKAGVKVDMGIKAGSACDPFSAFHIAPDLAVWYPADHFTFFATAGGGSEAQTLSLRSSLSKWVDPFEYSHVPVFSPIDAVIGFNAGPSTQGVRGISGGLSLRWKAVSHLPLYGWFPTRLMEAEVPGNRAPGSNVVLDDCQTTSLHGLQIAADIKYAPTANFALTAKGTYSPQNRTRGYFNGIDRPRFTVSASAEGRIAGKLTLRAAADWRGVRNIYSLDNAALRPERLPDWFSLQAEAEWQLLEHLGLGAGIYNITGRRNVELPGVPAEGITAAARLNWLF